MDAPGGKGWLISNVEGGEHEPIYMAFRGICCEPVSEERREETDKVSGASLDDHQLSRSATSRFAPSSRPVCCRRDSIDSIVEVT